MTTLHRPVVASPDHDRHQLTHAVDATRWDSPLGRCPVCARVVHGSLERRH